MQNLLIAICLLICVLVGDAAACNSGARATGGAVISGNLINRILHRHHGAAAAGNYSSFQQTTTTRTRIFQRLP